MTVPSTVGSPSPSRREPLMTPADELIAELLAPGAGPFALLRRLDPRSGRPGPVEVLRGPVEVVEHLADIPLRERTSRDARTTRR